MEKLRLSLQIIYYLIWIPLGILLLAVLVFLIVANPLAGLKEALQGGTPAPFGAGQGFPTPEMMRQFMQGQFAPPGK